jgi:DNA repair ATPase RecN
MSEAGKVSLPTPERIEEIKRDAQEEAETIYRNCTSNISNIELLGLLAALEEAQQQAELAYAAYEGLQGFCVSRGEYDSLLNKHSVLARTHREAQQTIAQQTRILNDTMKVLGRMKMIDARLWGVYCGIQSALGERVEEGETQP